MTSFKTCLHIYTEKRANVLISLGLLAKRGRNFRLAIALADMRDSWVNLSLILKDLATELPTPQRDEVALEVERYLARLQEAGRRGFD